jgi:hypothetical protein
MFPLNRPIEFINVSQVLSVVGCGISVIFSDGTQAFYPPEELALLRPYRETAKATLRLVALNA